MINSNFPAGTTDSLGAAKFLGISRATFHRKYRDKLQPVGSLLAKPVLFYEAHLQALKSASTVVNHGGTVPNGTPVIHVLKKEHDENGVLTMAGIKRAAGKRKARR